MSSFIPSAKHFNSIERSVIFLTQADFYFPYSLKNSFPELYNKRNYTQDAIDSKVKDTINTLRELTAICVTLQYKHHYEGTLDVQIQAETAELLNRTKGGEILNKLQLYKALSCLMYQIETEHLKELRGLTIEEENSLLFCKEMKIALASDIISDLPEYEKAKWKLQ